MFSITASTTKQKMGRCYDKKKRPLSRRPVTNPQWKTFWVWFFSRWRHLNLGPCLWTWCPAGHKSPRAFVSHCSTKKLQALCRSHYTSVYGFMGNWISPEANTEVWEAGTLKAGTSIDRQVLPSYFASNVAHATREMLSLYRGDVSWVEAERTNKPVGLTSCLSVLRQKVTVPLLLAHV